MEANSPNQSVVVPCAPESAPTPTRQSAAVSLVLPAWNEADTIVQAIGEADEALAACVEVYEVIVVDDGSTDQTYERATAAAALRPNVRVLRQICNSGYGAALRVGFIAARHELVAFTDADCQFDLADLEYMLPLAARYDVVSGYRIARQDSALRRFYSWGYNTLVKVLLGNPIRDIDCALKVFHRSQLSSILPESNNFFANTEMFARAQMAGLSIVDAGVKHRPRAAGQSKVSIADIPRTLSSLIPFWWNRVLFAGRAQVERGTERLVWPLLLLLAVVAGAMIFPNLAYPLIEPDEGRYAEIPREMLASGDWVVPHFQNRPYLDKPPLLYWMCAASYKIFGSHDWAARLVPATATFLSIMITFLFGRKIVGTRAAFFGSLALLLNVGFAGCGRFLVLDSLLSLLVLTSLFSAFLATRGSRLSMSWWVLSGAACGLGILTKGPVAFVLLFVPVVAYTWLSPQIAQPRVRDWLVLCGVAACLNLPWAIAMTLRDPGFFIEFLWQQNVMRFVSGAHHAHGFWYYLPVVMLGWMPWALLLVPLGKFLFSQKQTLRRDRPPELGFLVLWAGWCLFFFSLSKGKLPPYVMPAFPAIALLLGFFVDKVLLKAEGAVTDRAFSPEVFYRGTQLFCVLGICIAVTATTLRWLTPVEIVLRLVFWAFIIAAVISMRRKLTPAAVVGICGLLAFATVFDGIHVMLPGWARYRATLPTHKSSLIADLQNSTNAVACYGQDWGSVPFYLGRDDIRNFRKRSKSELVQFVEQRERAYLILDHSIDVEMVRNLLPADATLETVIEQPRATIVFVRTPDQQAARANHSARMTQVSITRH